MVAHIISCFRNIHAKSLFYIRSLTELRYLNLSNTSISALSLRHLYCTFSNFVLRWLARNVSDSNRYAVHCTALKNLETLSVYGCTLTASHIDVLRGMEFMLPDVLVPAGVFFSNSLFLSL